MGLAYSGALIKARFAFMSDTPATFGTVVEHFEKRVMRINFARTTLPLSNYDKSVIFVNGYFFFFCEFSKI